MNFDQLDLTILKGLITDKKQALDFVQECDDKLFLPETWNFSSKIINYIKFYKELPTLRVLIEKLGKSVNEKQLENIKAVWEATEKIVYNDKEFKHDVEKLKNRFAEKQLINIKENLVKLAPGTIDVNRAISDMQKTIQNIQNLDQYKVYESKNIKDYLPEFVEKFNAKKENPELDRGIMTGYSFLDYSTNGAKPADFILIAGESGFGKSLFLNNIAVQVWMQNNTLKTTEFSKGNDVAYVSVEMPFADCFNRLLSRLSGVQTRKIENAKLTKEEFSKIKESLDFIKKYPYQFKIIDVPEASANDIEHLLVNSGDKFDAVFIDYLGIMKTNKPSEEADWLKQSEIAREVRAIGRKYALPIFSAVQLNRKSPGKDSAENIGLNRLARSSGIATHATHVVQIESRSNERSYPDFLYHIIKARKGSLGKGVLIKNFASATLLDKIVENTEMTETNLPDDYFTDVDDISDEMDKLEL